VPSNGLDSKLRTGLKIGEKSFGITRGSVVDKTIDFIIGLESLHLPQENQELTYKIAVRIAYSLEQSTKKEKDYSSL
jgi:hypothetical protein